MAVLIKKLGAIGVILATSVLIFVYAYYSLVGDVIEQRSVINSGQALIALSTFHGYLPGLLTISAGSAGFSLAMVAFLYREAWYRKLAPVCSAVLLAGIVMTLCGSLVAGSYWGKKAERAGYVKCGLTSQVSSAKAHTNYWASSPSICDDSQVSQWLNQSRGDLRRVNQRLKRSGR